MPKQQKLAKTGSKPKPSISIALVRPSFVGTLGGSLKPRQLLISWNTKRPYGPCSCRYVSGRIRPSKIKGFS